jgi:hypothetical protein
MVEMEAVAEPPIIDRSGRAVGCRSGDTEKMTGDEVPCAGGRRRHDRRRKKRKRKKTDLGVGDTMPPKTAVMEAVAEDAADRGGRRSDGDRREPVQPPEEGRDEGKEEKVDANRLGFIPLGDGDFQLPPVNLSTTTRARRFRSIARPCSRCRPSSSRRSRTTASRGRSPRSAPARS